MNSLRKNQLEAIEESIRNDFSSGIHFHATGTGKSWIAMNLLLEYNRLYPEDNILWICEHQSILVQQFEKQRLREMGISHIQQRFLVLDYSQNKSPSWTRSVNTARFWKKPVLLIINRPFLTSQKKYRRLTLPFGLVIHDESHTIGNTSTRELYHYLLERHIDLRCIGFTATPCIDHKPFDRILTSYSIYDAFKDGVVVAPKIVWMESLTRLPKKEWIRAIKTLIETLPYQKILVWCGMMDLCHQTARSWKKFFPDFFIGVDTSQTDDRDFCIFSQRAEKGLLFCAAKHREGSDIPNLDGCIFMDGVTNRSAKTFVQCVGRVLRRDKAGRKTFGLVLDIRAKSPSRIFQRVHKYLHLDPGHFPWEYESSLSKGIKLHHLLMVKKDAFSEGGSVPTIRGFTLPGGTLASHFTRSLPSEETRYRERLSFELTMIASKRLESYLLQAVEILRITRGIPHITRGSCGSSLVCFMLGISHVDPVLHGIQFARFLNEHRQTLPDIDFDFPHHLRDEVFLKCELRWPGCVARISNHVYFHKKSALRQAIRNVGIRRFIPKESLRSEIQKLDPSTRKAIEEESNRLEETFRGFSLHCGGIVFFPEGVPEELILKNSNSRRGIISQIRLNKEEVARNKDFKIDILSSRALAQLYEGTDYAMIDFEEPATDEKAFDLLASGNNIGITFAESPLIRKALMKFRPRTIADIALCMAIIRPAARDARKAEVFSPDLLVFDDDGIDLIAQSLGCSEADADKYRRAFAKKDKKGITELTDRISSLPDMDESQRKALLKKLTGLGRYSFCKSHAFSYAQLIYQLARLKAHSPQKFWASTLRHCQGSYRKWVHLYEARRVNVTLKSKPVSIYAQNRRNTIHDCLSPEDQVRRFGYWDMENGAFFPGCYYHEEASIMEQGSRRCQFRGLIALSRVLKTSSHTKIIIFLGVQPGVYIDVEWEDQRGLGSRWIGIEGHGVVIDPVLSRIRVEEYILF